MLKIIQVESLNQDHYSDDFHGDEEDDPATSLVLDKFVALNSRYTYKLAQETLEIARGEGYVSFYNGQHYGLVTLTHKGYVLLTKSGYFNALCKSLGNVWTVIAVIVSLVGLAVSIWT
jgi:hypothetical protein